VYKPRKILKDFLKSKLSILAGDQCISTGQDLKQKRNCFEDTHFDQVLLKVVLFAVFCRE